MFERLDNNFWDAFVAGAWGKGPRIFRNVFTQPFYSKVDLTAALGNAAAALMSSGAPACRIRAYADDIEVGLDNLQRMAPFLGELDGFLGHAMREFRASSVAMFIEPADVALPELGERMAAFVEPLFARIGAPSSGINAALIMGSYGRTPFKVHVDDCHVFMMTASAKQMAFWPREQLEPVAEGQVDGKIELTDEMRKSAEIVTIGPNDLLYWPASYWHVGLGEKGAESDALSLGIYHQNDAANLVRELDFLPTGAMRNAGLANFDLLNIGGLTGAQGPEWDPEFVPPELAALRVELRKLVERLSNPAEVTSLIQRLAMKKLTSGGFAFAPTRIPKEARVSLTRKGAIAFSVRGPRCAVVANGRAFEYTSDPGLIAFLRELGRGETAKIMECLPSNEVLAHQVLDDLSSAGAIRHVAS